MVFKLIKKFPICMEEESSLVCSKRPVLDPIMIQLNSINLFIFCFSEFPSNFIFQFMAYFPKCDLLIALKFLEKMLNTFHSPLTHVSWSEYLILLDLVILASIIT